MFFKGIPYIPSKLSFAICIVLKINLSIASCFSCGFKSFILWILRIPSVTSSIVEQSITKLVEKAVEDASSNEDLELVTDIVENSKGTIGDKIVSSANKNEESKQKITKIIVKVVEKNPEKAVEIIEKNKNTNTVLETVKNKIENNEAVTSEDFKEVFDANVSPN